MRTRIVTALAAAVLVGALASPSAAQQPVAQPASQPPVQQPQPAAPPRPVAQPPQAPAQKPPARQAPPAPGTAPAVVVPPTMAPVSVGEQQAQEYSTNYRVDVQVTDRLDEKVLGRETFNALVRHGTQAKLSRTTASVPPMSAALQIRVSGLDPRRPLGSAVSVTLGAQFTFARGAAGEKDPGVEIGQEVSVAVALDKPTIVIDLSSGSEGRRRFVVQVTVTRVPVE
jgi:hypothetical protein